MELSIGRIIHVVGDATPTICMKADVGGKFGEDWWIAVLSFRGYNITWLSDVNWHDPRQCPHNQTT